MPDPSLLTPLGIAYRDSLPPVLRDDPDYLAIIHALAREMERFQAQVDVVRRQLVPTTADVLLKAWEAMLRLPIEPAGQTIAQRQNTVKATLRRTRVEFGKGDWIEAINTLIGPGWTYEEHVPGVVGTPPANTIRVHLPFGALSYSFGLARRLILTVTPANTDILFVSAEGFILDSSALDTTAFGY